MLATNSNDFINVQSPILENLSSKPTEADSEFLSSIEKSFQTKYYTQWDFTKTKTSNDLSILNFNIRSVQKNFETFKAFYESLNFNFDIICLTETWEDSNHSMKENSLFNLTGYNFSQSTPFAKKRRRNSNIPFSS